MCELRMYSIFVLLLALHMSETCKCGTFSSLHLAASQPGEAYAAACDAFLSVRRAAHLNDLDRAGRWPVRGLCPGVHLGIP